MEWIIGIFVLWLIVSLFGSSSKNRDTTFKGARESSRESVLSEDQDVRLEEKPAITVVRPSISDSPPIAGRSLDAEPPPYDEIPPWIQEDIESCNVMPSWIQEDESSKIIDVFNQYGVSSIWHMTHKDNISEILASGILSHQAAYKIKNPIDISDHGAQRWREAKEPIYGRRLHEYVPTYINIKNPMLYVRRNMQHYLCIIEISLTVLIESEYIFTDGNAASRNTRFFGNANDLYKLPWDVLNASYWNDYPDGKRKRCSEVLIHPMIHPEHIIKIHCCSKETYQFLGQFGMPIQISENLFFGKCPSGATSRFPSFDDDIPF